MTDITAYADFITWPRWAETKVFDTPIKSFIVAAITFTIVYFLVHGLLNVARRVLPEIPRGALAREKVEESLANIKEWTLIAIALYCSLQGFNLPARLDFLVNLACFAMITIQILLIANIWIRFVFRDSPLVKGTHSQIRTMSGSLTTVAIIVCWTLAFLLLFDNFGFDVKTIVAGLGVGGLAIGLALQSVLGDIIASFSIGFDAPFEVGDFIIVDDLMGTVERVGLKTTRIRSLGGELLVFPNSKLVSSKIQNYKRMQQRRVVFSFGVTYDIPQDSLEQVPAIVKEAVTSTKTTRFDRAHFARYGDSALEFEVVYYVLAADYNVYMDIQQDINLKIRREFQKRDINFAFPTRVIDLPPELREVLGKIAERNNEADHETESHEGTRSANAPMTHDTGRPRSRPTTRETTRPTRQETRQGGWDKDGQSNVARGAILGRGNERPTPTPSTHHS